VGTGRGIVRQALDRPVRADREQEQAREGAVDHQEFDAGPGQTIVAYRRA
jgi:hypothetical protein